MSTTAADRNEPTPRTSRDRPQLQEALEHIVDSGITGITMRVRDEHGEWVGAAGLAELGGTSKPPTDGHVRIGSNTKTFVATVVLRLVAEGRVGLDAPVADHLRGFGIDERVTARMLLQHTSGIFNFTGEYYADGTFAPGIAATTAGREWVDNRFKAYRPDELARLALSKPARFEPGTDWSYSNTNYVLARLLVEEVTGRSMAEETQRLIVGPLGLTGTAVPASPEIPEPHAHAYYRYEDDGGETTVDVTRHDPSWISSGGDMISTSADLHTFISALTGGELLPAELLAEMCTPRPTPIPDMGYGLGVFVQDTGQGGTVVTHNGGAAGHAALMYGTPDGRRSLTATLNYVDDAALSLAVPFQQATQRLVDEVFRGGQAR